MNRSLLIDEVGCFNFYPQEIGNKDKVEWERFDDFLIRQEMLRLAELKAISDNTGKFFKGHPDLSKTKDMVVFEIAGVNHILASPLETFEFTVCRSMTDCHTYKKYLNELTEPEKNLLIAEFVKEGNTIYPKTLI